MLKLKKPDVLLCLSALLLALGTYFATVEVSVWTGGEYDLMHVYTLPFSFPLWILASVFFVYGIALGGRKPSALAQSRKPFLTIESIVAITLGALALISTFLPWVIAEATNPVFERPGFGTMNIGQYHELTGVSLMGANYWMGDAMYLTFIGAIIAVSYSPLLASLNTQRTGAMQAFLSLLGGSCILSSVVSVFLIERWSIAWSFAGGTGGSLAAFKSPGIGILIAASSAVGLIVFGLVGTVRFVRRRKPLVD